MSVQTIKKIRLGDLLVQQGHITRQQLYQALKTQQERGGKLGEILLQLKYIDEKKLITSLSEQLKIPFVDLKNYPIKQHIVRRLPQELSAQCRVLLLEDGEKRKEECLVGMVDPTDLIAYDVVTRLFGREMRVAIILENDFLDIFNATYKAIQEPISPRPSQKRYFSLDHPPLPEQKKQEMADKIFKTDNIHKFKQLGIPEVILSRIEKTFQKPYGIILVTGPLHSGKTILLYTLLSTLALEASKIITLGEMQDEESVKFGLQAALTEKWVLSTLTLDSSLRAINAVEKILSLGAPGFLIAELLKGILSKCLLRRLCDHCKESYQPSVKEITWIKTRGYAYPSDLLLKQAKGCLKCDNTGFQDPIALYEWLEIDETMAEALRKNEMQTFIRLARKQLNSQKLINFAVEHAIQGVITLEDAIHLDLP